MHILVVYIPETHIEKLKEALFQAQGGETARYDHCSWQTMGLGQFRPLEGSHPFIGNPGTLESVKEYRLEMVVAEQYIPQILNALLKTHPYEEPAYHLYPVKTLADFAPPLQKQT